MGFIGWIVLGLIAGTIAKAVVGGGSDTGSWVGSLALGVLGGVVGGWLSSLLFNVPLGEFWSIKTWIIAILGAFLVTFIFNKLTNKN